MEMDPTFFARPLNAAKSGDESPRSKSFLFVRELAKFAQLQRLFGIVIRMDTDKRLRVADASSESVSIGVHPW
jgi:hypothetical protein